MTLLAAFLSGFAILALEVLGVHLASAWFGASAMIWTNQIGVVLAALAVGGWLGGRAAHGHGDPSRLAGRLLAGAGFLLAFAVVSLPWFAEAVLPENLDLDSAAAIFFGGSLGAALLFYAPPVLLLAMVSPLLVQARAQSHGAGRAAGQLYASGTLGSLLGTFCSTYLFLPVVGVRWTLSITAVALLLAGSLMARVPRPLAAIALLLLPLPLLPDASWQANLPALGELEARVIDGSERETPYQRLRVIEVVGDDGVAERRLQMNEGLDSFQSMWTAASLDGPQWTRAYYDLFALAPFYAGELGEVAPEAGTETRFWCLGSGTGTLFGPLSLALQGRPWEAVAVELDPEVVALGETYMPLPPGLEQRVRTLSGIDGRAALRAAPDELDMILVDAYARQFEIPLHLATVEFFSECHARLRRGGVLALNLGTTETLRVRGGLVDALRASLAASFGENVRVQTVPFSRNLALFARREARLPDQGWLGEHLAPGLPPTLGAACLPGQVLDGAPPPGTPLLEDDRNRLALAQARAWWEASR
jgi:MFS family permease